MLPDKYVAVCEGKTWQQGVVMNFEERDMVIVTLRDWDWCHLMSDHRHVHIGGSISGDQLASPSASWPRRIKIQVAPEK